MDIIDLFWNFSQDGDIRDLKASHTKAVGKNADLVKRLQEENYELRIRVSLLIRLLIERGVFTADDFTSLLNETKAQLTAATANPALQRTGSAVTAPASTPPPSPAHTA